MPPWLQATGLADPAAGAQPWVLAARLLLALLLGLVVAAIHQRTTGEVTPAFRATLVLLTILIAAVTQVIGDNVARAFSLVGALSIVRFRTVVQDTRDTAFVIFAVTVGMAVGAGDLWVAALSLGVVALAAVVLAYRLREATAAPERFQLIVCVALAYQADQLLAPIFAAHAQRVTVVGISTASRGAALETTYEVALRPSSSPADLVHAVTDLEGVQSVQLRLASV